VNERAFRLDFFIAICAVLISALTAGTLIYQTRVIGDQFAATIWPYLSVGATYDVSGETIEVTNDGVGPALIRSAELRVDGKTVRAWNDYITVLARDPQTRPILRRVRALVRAGAAARVTMSSIGPSSALRPGESHTLLKIALPVTVPTAALVKHSVAMDFCYCSLNGSCWILHARVGQISPDPQQVSRCDRAAAIQSYPVPAPASARSTR
jgi:hypothetical protein